MSRNAGDASRTGTISAATPSVRPGAISEALEDTWPSAATPLPAEWGEALKPGAVVGRFQLIREVGKGGFGLVYEAFDRELNRRVAFKAVRPGPRQEIRQERLLREAEKAAQLSHPNIVTLYDVGRTEHGPYLVMELLRGTTLLQRLHREPLSLREALRVAVEAAKGLAHAHAQGVIHRDLTPGNVFLCEDGQVKVVDLGLAHAFGHRKIDGGTPAYMAPEQMRGAPEDERTDVFSLGVILYQMLSGQLPFGVERRKEYPETAPPLDVSKPELAALVARMLSADPVRRPRDAAEVLEALAAVQEELERSDQGETRPHRRPPPISAEQVKPERTWVCSVLAADIVRYAEQTVELQAAWKARLNGCLTRAVHDLPEADRLVLDSGSGLAVCFLGDPDGAMSCALALLGMVLREESVQRGGMRVRFGMHLGAVKLLKDINGNLNALGDGLLVAQRMMGFAGENQILVSRAFHDVASCLSDAYRPLFGSAGTRRDEQMREHAVYELRLPEAPRASRSASFEHEPRPPGALDPAIGSAIERRAAVILGPIAHHLARTVGGRASSPRELGEALAAFMPVSGDREAFMRFCSSEPRPAPAATASTPAPTPPSSISPFSPDVLERAGRDLAGYLGPMARILVSRTSAKARSEEELYDLLAAEIQSQKDREEFLRKGAATRRAR